MVENFIKLFESSKNKDIILQEQIWQALNGSVQDVEEAILEILEKKKNNSLFSSITNILDILSSGPIFKILLEKLISNQVSLAKIQSYSYYHQNGFDKFVLFDNQYFKLRLHVWQPENIDKAQENIHDHRWAFGSKILYGSFQNQFFEINEQGDIERLFYTYLPAYKDQKYDLKYNGESKLNLLNEINLQASQLYYLAPEILHRISQVNSNGCATLMLTGNAFRMDCRLFSEREILEHEKINASFAKSYIVSVFHQVTEKIQTV